MMRRVGWTAAQLAGGVAALAGLWLLAGVAVALLVGGLAVVAVSTLAEMAAPRVGGR